MNPECHSNGKQMSRLGNRSHILFPSQWDTKRCQQLWKEKRNQCFLELEMLRASNRCTHPSALTSVDRKACWAKMCRGWMEMKRFFPPSPQWKTYHKGKTNPVLIMPLKSQMAPIHDFMVFLVELKRIVVYSNAQIFFFFFWIIGLIITVGFLK